MEDQVVADVDDLRDAIEDEEECFFQDIGLLQEHGIVRSLIITTVPHFWGRLNVLVLLRLNIKQTVK